MEKGFGWLGAFGLWIALAALACGGSSSDAQTPTVDGQNAYQGQPQAPGGQPGVYAPPGATVVQSPPTQPGQYTGPGQTVAPQPTTPPPSPLAAACTDLTAPIVCGGHRCNPQNNRCALPCGSNLDCMPGFSCLGAGGPTAICVPGAGGK